MDKKISRTINVLDALESYFESLTDYLKQTDHSKFSRLAKWIEWSTEFKNQFIQIASKPLDVEANFQIVHLYTSLIGLLRKIYDALDFQIPEGEEISKTRAYRLTDVFNKITTVYRLYIRDLGSQIGDIVTSAAAGINTTPLELQRMWRAWPNSIDLYTLLMTAALNKTYQDKKGEGTAIIFSILDADKRFILEEYEWISPYLTFNCVPHVATPEPVEFDEIATILKVKASTAADISSETHAAIVVTRVMSGNLIHLLPTSVGWGPGITKTDVYQTLKPVNSGTWDWHLKIFDTKTSREYCILEYLGEKQWRILVAARQPGAWITRDTLVTKIKEKVFGRPMAYHLLLQQSLQNNLSTRVANLAMEKARKSDLGLNILRVTDLLTAEFKRLRGPLHERLESESLDQIFENAILFELQDQIHLLDALLFWVEWTRRDFRKELNLRMSKNIDALSAKEVTAVSEHYVQTLLHDSVGTLLNKHDNIFQDLFDKQHKLDVIRQNT